MNSKKTSLIITDTSHRNTVKVAGFMFLFTFIVPTINWAFVLSKLNIEGNAVATAKSIIANEFLFRLGITIELFMSVGLIILGLVLYTILKNVNRNLALLALSLKLVEATIMAITVLIPFIALEILNSNTPFTTLTQEQLLFPLGKIFNSHTAITSIPMVFLGLDMLIFSYLFLKSKYIPRILAGFGILSFALVLIQSLMFILGPEYATRPINQIIFWTPSSLFEIIIGIWLLAKGINVLPRKNQEFS